MKKIYAWLLLLSCYACQSTDNAIQEKIELSIDNTLASLYPIQDKWLELQNLEWTDNENSIRDFKKSEGYRILRKDIFSTYCKDEYCLQINPALQLEIIDPTGKSSEKVDFPTNSFFFPVKEGWITVTSLPDENLFSIKKLDENLQEKWNTIYEKSRLDSNGISIPHTRLLGYNDHLLIFHSPIPNLRKSGYIQLSDGVKMQSEENWSSLIIDEDQSTVLGQLIQREDLSYILKAGSRAINLPESITGFTHTQSLISGNQIFLSFYFQNNDILKTYAIDYHSGQILWDHSLVSSKSIKDVVLSTFQNKFIIEIFSPHRNGLYILDKQEGKLLDKF